MMAIDKAVLDARREKFREAFDYVPGSTAAAKLDWVAKSLGVARASVRAWNSSTAHPITEPKLNLLKLKLASHLADVAAKLGQQ